MWNNILEQGRSEIIIWCMRIAWWITKVVNTHPEYVMLIAFPLQQWLHEKAPLLRYTLLATGDATGI